jgi:hypothetical protein
MSKWRSGAYILPRTWNFLLMKLFKRSLGNVVRIVAYCIGWMTEELCFNSHQGQEIFLFSKMSKAGLGAYTAYSSMGTGASFLEG